MARRTIRLFMWGYQTHYRAAIQSGAKSLLDALGVADAQPFVFLIGVRTRDSSNPNIVCIEPESAIDQHSIFDDVLDDVEIMVQSHELQAVMYGDERANREKPSWIRRGSVTRAVQQVLAHYDKKREFFSYYGTATKVGEYYVVPIVRIPIGLRHDFPPLAPFRELENFSKIPLSLLDSVMDQLLAKATRELETSEPGHSLINVLPRTGEMVREAARNLMYVIGLAVRNGYDFSDLFERFNAISALLYEGNHSVGQLILADLRNTSIKFQLKFKTPVPFSEHRWSRKALQMAKSGSAIISDTHFIYGLGGIATDHDPAAQDIFVVDFLEHYSWQVRIGLRVLLRSRYGEPKLPHDPMPHQRFVENYRRIFREATNENAELLWTIFNSAARIDRGSLIVVAEDAAEEAERLDAQGTAIQPIEMTEELLERVSRIDGSILLDPSGTCYAIGVVLDGAATADCTPSRGARFNSGVRYVQSTAKARLAIIVSEDRTIDVVPLLRPRVARDEIERQIRALEGANSENYHRPQGWLSDHRFYLNAEQCERVNVALDRVEAFPRDVGEIVLTTRRLEPDPRMTDEYLM
ncbi:MAG TPA: hypothetical protein VKY24_05740 [Reyranella sp.]|nr:hypothetical protein [Reyranella sp.]